MKQKKTADFSRRLLCGVLILALLLSCLAVSAFGTTGETVHNTAERHTVCTALSAQAEAYYTGDYAYDTLASLEGVYSPTDSWLATQDNALYTALYTLMDTTNTFRGVCYAGYSANALATHWLNTDSASDTDSYLYFYTDVDAAGTGYTMNREHVWPKSKASFYQINGGADLHHLRPSVSGVNSSKSNRAFGNVRAQYPDCGSYDVDGEAVIWTGGSMLEVRDNIKGDVARILLYVYVRWQQPNLYSTVSEEHLPELDRDDTANSGEFVIESLETLLQWMEEDPVDEWEMARNDAVERVQGNRNVFIDYPEFAWQLFNLIPPADMETPSGEAMGNAHIWDSGIVLTEPTCTEPGRSVFTCTDCGITRQVSTPALGHTTEAAAETSPATCTEAGYVKYLCSRCGAETEQTVPATGHQYVDGICTVCGQAVNCFTLTNTLADGEQVVVYNPAAGKALSSEFTNTVYHTGASATVEEDELYLEDTTAIWNVTAEENGYTLTALDGTVLATGSGNGLPADGEDTVWYVTEAATENCIYLYNQKYLEWYSSFGDFTSYSYSDRYETGYALQLFTRVACDHSEIELRSAKATCLQEGYKDAEFCTICGAKLTEGTVKEALGHDFGEPTTEKSPSCTEIGYSSRSCSRCTAKTYEVTEALGHNCTETVTEPTCTKDGYTEHTCMRCELVYRDTYTDALGHDAVNHPGKTPTCLEDGWAAYQTCNRCDYTNYKALPALGHNYAQQEARPATCTEVGWDAYIICTRCDYTTYQEQAALGHDFAAHEGKPASCTEIGWEPYETCNRCEYSSYKELAALGHNFVDGKCTRCDAEDPDYEAKDPCEGYTDIDRKAWYHTAVDFVIASGLMGSTKADTLTFEPNTKVSRAMVASILYRMAEAPAVEYKGTFTDVPAGKWYSNAVEWCAQNGLASGKGNGKFDPNGNVTRQELAVFMKKMAEYLKEDTTATAELSTFADGEKVPAWAKDYISWAVAAGLISGKASNGQTYLAPTDNATRAELASILMRF